MIPFEITPSTPEPPGLPLELLSISSLKPLIGGGIRIEAPSNEIGPSMDVDLHLQKSDIDSPWNFLA